MLELVIVGSSGATQREPIILFGDTYGVLGLGTMYGLNCGRSDEKRQRLIVETLHKSFLLNCATVQISHSNINQISPDPNLAPEPAPNPGEVFEFVTYSHEFPSVHHKFPDNSMLTCRVEL